MVDGEVLWTFLNQVFGPALQITAALATALFVCLLFAVSAAGIGDKSGTDTGK